MIKIEIISRHMAKNIEKTKRPMIKIETISRHNYGRWLVFSWFWVGVVALCVCLLFLF
jgi:uncharacterized membrane protein YjjP (DUF1212 family)